MARWFLKDRHYLNVPGTEWEYKERDRDTGREYRIVLPVPLYLDPGQAADWNDRANERIVVSNKYDSAFPRDHVFVGQPTPDMVPIDDEAQAITDDYVARGAWKHPIESMDMTYSQSILSEFERAIINKTMEKIQIQPPNVSAGVSQKQFDDLQATVKQLMEQNASLQAQMLEKPKSFRRF